jgi:hypothetical protein
MQIRLTPLGASQSSHGLPAKLHLVLEALSNTRTVLLEPGLRPVSLARNDNMRAVEAE